MHNAGTTLSGQPRVGTWPDVERRKDALRRRIAAHLHNRSGHTCFDRLPAANACSECLELTEEVLSLVRNASPADLEEILR